MTDMHDSLMPDAPLSDDGAAAILATLNQSTVNLPTGEPTATEPAGAVPSDAEEGVTLPGGNILDMAPKPPEDNIVTQYAYLQEDKPLPVVAVFPNMRDEITLNNFRYLRDNKIKSFINHKVKRLAAQKTAMEAQALESRVSDHILALRNAGLGRVEEANAGVHELHTALKKMERKFSSDEVITLRNDNYELNRELTKREMDWRALWAYTGELREKNQKLMYRALQGMSKTLRLKFGVHTLMRISAEHTLFEMQDLLAAKQLQAELELAVSGRYRLRSSQRLREARGAAQG